MPIRDTVGTVILSGVLVVQVHAEAPFTYIVTAHALVIVTATRLVEPKGTELAVDEITVPLLIVNV